MSATDLDIGNWLRLAADKPIDPYSLWAMQTGFRRFIGRRQAGLLTLAEEFTFLVELNDPYQAGGSWPGPIGPIQPVVPSGYGRALPGENTSGGPCFVSLRVPTSNIDVVSMQGVIRALVADPKVKRLQMGSPRPAMQDRVVPPDCVVKRPSATLAPAPPKTVLVAVLDDACPFGHAALTDAGATRVTAVWDQSTRKGNTAMAPAGFGYGDQWLQQDLNQLIRRYQRGGELDEETLYNDPNFPQGREGLRRRASHAAAVIGLAAGRRAAMPTPLNGDVDKPSPLAKHPLGSDAAEDAALVVVKFPREQVAVAAGRWLSVHALDGLRYVALASMDLAAAGAPPLPTVVNMSFGGVAGAHDGTGLLECAMDALHNALRDFRVVLAAGNAYGTERQADGVDPLAYRPSGAHASATLKSGKQTMLYLSVPPDKQFETYLEVWLYPESGDSWIGPQEVEIVVTLPTGQQLKQAFDGIEFARNSSFETTAGLICLSKVPQSERHSMALLVIAATQVSSSFVEAPCGEWQVEVKNKGSRELRMEAWVERDITHVDHARRQGARLVASGVAGAAVLNDDETLNNVGTGSRTTLVGALVDQPDPVAPSLRRVSAYSSAGGKMCMGPSLSAVADEGVALAGIRVAGTFSGTVVRLNGTSMAAPQATRHLASHIAGGPAATPPPRSHPPMVCHPRRGTPVP